MLRLSEAQQKLVAGIGREFGYRRLPKQLQRLTAREAGKLSLQIRQRIVRGAAEAVDVSREPGRTGRLIDEELQQRRRISSIQKPGLRIEQLGPLIQEFRKR